MTSDDLLERLKSLHPLMIDLSLDRVCGLLDKLGRPQNSLPNVIHVAGTNGKGSTIAFMQALLSAAGMRVHTYTSPHLVRFHERIQLAGDDGVTRPISEQALVDVLSRVSAVNADAPMTFFEITTAAALLAFSECTADVVLLEVGLGGRLDATNVVGRPAMTVITPVSIDHADKLGDTLEKIAFEKAGILKPSVPAVVGPQPPAALAAICAAADLVEAKLYKHGEHHDAFEERGRLIFQREHSLLDLPMPSLVGRNQVINAGVALAAVLTTFGDGIPMSALEQGMTKAHWPARFTRICSLPLGSQLGAETEIWLDGGHNPAAAAALAQTLGDLEERSPKPVHLVVAMMAQKDAAGFLAPFRGIVKGIRTVTIPNEPNAMSAAALCGHAVASGFTASPAESVESAVTEIESDWPGPKRILICGSLYLAGQVLSKTGFSMSNDGQA
ncbi:MAG: bifunctional folylpolyglutamate synthase/dihydrofolate synthase [Hyphomicrobiaceae bacterium]